MKLRHIEVFNAIMLTGSVSGAARLTHVTQPAVTRLLQHAELQLGFPLFARVKGRLVPTREATTLFPLVDRVFIGLDDVQRLAASLKSAQKEDHLRLLIAPALSHELLPRALKVFRARHARVTLHIETLHSAKIVAAIALREADIGFVYGSGQHPAVAQALLAEGALCCVIPLAMTTARRWAKLRDAVALTDLAGLPCVALDARDPVGAYLNQACREAGVDLEAVATVQTYHAALALAHHGLGIAIIDSFTAASADVTRVCVVKLVPTIPIPIRALRAAQAPDSLVARAMVRAFLGACKT